MTTNTKTPRALDFRCPNCDAQPGHACKGSRIPGANTLGGGWGGPPDRQRPHDERYARRRLAIAELAAHAIAFPKATTTPADIAVAVGTEVVDIDGTDRGVVVRIHSIDEERTIGVDGGEVDVAWSVAGETYIEAIRDLRYPPAPTIADLAPLCAETIRACNVTPYEPGAYTDAAHAEAKAVAAHVDANYPRGERGEAAYFVTVERARVFADFVAGWCEWCGGGYVDVAACTVTQYAKGRAAHVDLPCTPAFRDGYKAAHLDNENGGGERPRRSDAVDAAHVFTSH